MKPFIPTSERIAQPSAVGRFVEREFATITPADMRTYLSQADRASKLEVFADLGEWILEDDRVSAVVDTRIDFVSSLPFELKPGRARPGMEALAQKAADDCAAMLESTDRLTMVFENLAYSYYLGYSGAEHLWGRDGGWWVSNPCAIRSRDIGFSENWKTLVRSYEGGNRETWLDCEKYHGKFITFLMRRRGSTPMRSGLLRNVAFLWLAKRWALKFWLSGAERLATPPMLGRVTRTANAKARDTLKSGLENLTEGQAAILEEETNIEFPDTKFATTSDVWDKLVNKLDAAITIAALGSLDNTDAGAGSYARAESQAAVNLDPRNSKLAYLLYEVVERDWLAPFLYLNSDKYGGVVPPTPRMCPAEGEIREIKPIQPYHMTSGIVTRNEVRAQLGLDPLDDSRGGNEFLTDSALGGGDAAIPLARDPVGVVKAKNLDGTYTVTMPIEKAMKLTSTKAATSGMFYDLPPIDVLGRADTSAARQDSLPKPQSTAPVSSPISAKSSRRVSARRPSKATRKG